MSGAKKAKKLWNSLKGVVIAFAIVFIIIGGLYLYSGVWPPLVVIESASMQHSDSRSYIGVIDTGDLVILKEETALSSVRTYLGSVNDGYSTYGELGDVVIYRPNGDYGTTPIIHRALCEIVYNQTGGGFDVPALASVPDSMWDVEGGEKAWYNLHTVLVLHDIGYNQVDVDINFGTIISNFGASTPEGGLITLGDNNHGNIDQTSLIKNGKYVKPIKGEWLNGIARGELPWFGIIKLFASGQSSYIPIPQNSKTNLLISLGLIIGIPILIDATSLILESKGISVGAWFRKKLGLPPKKAKPPEEPEKADEEMAPAKKASGANPQGKSKSSASNQKPKGSSGKKGKGSR